MAVILPKIVWNSDKILDFEWSGFQEVKTVKIVTALAWSFKNQTIWNPIFEKSRLWIFLDFQWSDFSWYILDPYCTGWCTINPTCLSLNLFLGTQFFCTLLSNPNKQFYFATFPFPSIFSFSRGVPIQSTSNGTITNLVSKLIVT